MKDYSAYIALGDSMSIDLYPALELQDSPDLPVGAAALMYQNEGRFWPDFEGKDLKTANPQLTFINLAEDGATTWDILNKPFQKHLRVYSSQPVLITLTVGGNDALQMSRLEPNRPSQLTAKVADIISRYSQIIESLRNDFPQATVILNSIYDPSDGTGTLPVYPSFTDKLPFLHFINDRIQHLAQVNGYLFADVHARFLEHGLSAPPGERWYWEPSPIEPSARGASELRRLWLEALDGATGT